MPNPSELTVRLETGATTTALVYRAAGDHAPPAALILGHGAGAGQRSAFMVDFAAALSSLGVDVVTFNFLYTEQGRKIPDRAPALEACYRAVIDAVRAGSSRRDRRCSSAASRWAGASRPRSPPRIRHCALAGLVLLGYPLHPPGRPDQRRDKHLPAIARPMLFVQGARDAFGTPDELAPILGALQPPPELHVVGQGDHSFKLSRKDPAAQATVYADVQRAIVSFVSSAP